MRNFPICFSLLVCFVGITYSLPTAGFFKLPGLPGFRSSSSSSSSNPHNSHSYSHPPPRNPSHIHSYNDGYKSVRSSSPRHHPHPVQSAQYSTINQLISSPPISPPSNSYKAPSSSGSSSEGYQPGPLPNFGLPLPQNYGPLPIPQGQANFPITLGTSATFAGEQPAFNNPVVEPRPSVVRIVRPDTRGNQNLQQFTFRFAQPQITFAPNPYQFQPLIFYSVPTLHQIHINETDISSEVSKEARPNRPTSSEESSDFEIIPSLPNMASGSGESSMSTSGSEEITVTGGGYRGGQSGEDEQEDSEESTEGPMAADENFELDLPEILRVATNPQTEDTSATTEGAVAGDSDEESERKKQEAEEEAERKRAEEEAERTRKEAEDEAERKRQEEEEAAKKKAQEEEEAAAAEKKRIEEEEAAKKKAAEEEAEAARKAAEQTTTTTTTTTTAASTTTSTSPPSSSTSSSGASRPSTNPLEVPPVAENEIDVFEPAVLVVADRPSSLLSVPQDESFMEGSIGGYGAPQALISSIPKAQMPMIPIALTMNDALRPSSGLEQVPDLLVNDQIFPNRFYGTPCHHFMMAQQRGMTPAAPQPDAAQEAPANVDESSADAQNTRESDFEVERVPPSSIVVAEEGYSSTEPSESSTGSSQVTGGYSTPVRSEAPNSDNLQEQEQDNSPPQDINVPSVTYGAPAQFETSTTTHEPSFTIEKAISYQSPAPEIINPNQPAQHSVEPELINGNRIQGGDQETTFFTAEPSTQYGPPGFNSGHPISESDPIIIDITAPQQQVLPSDYSFGTDVEYRAPDALPSESQFFSSNPKLKTDDRISELINLVSRLVESQERSAEIMIRQKSMEVFDSSNEATERFEARRAMPLPIRPQTLSQQIKNRGYRSR